MTDRDASGRARSDTEAGHAATRRDVQPFFTDVIVVGGGGSGLAAAIEAAKSGRSVVLLEKAEQLGGTTALSIGSISATLTPHQINKGIKDSPAGHCEDMPKFAAGLDATDNHELRTILTDNVPETVKWLMSLGVEFFGPMPEAPHRLPRMHNVIPSSRAYIAHCAREARRVGVDIRTGVQAEGLIIEDGSVRGVHVKTPSGATNEYRCNGAVVLATGDYSANPHYKHDLIAPSFSRIQPVNPNSTGDGHRMALELGASIINGHLAHTGVRFVRPPRNSLAQALPASRLLGKAIRVAMEKIPMSLLRPFLMKFLVTVMEPAPKLFQAGAIIIGSDGELLGDWDSDRASALAASDDQTGYILIDSNIAKTFDAWPNYISTAPGVAYAYLSDYRRTRPDIYQVSPDLAGVAESLGSPVDVLEATIAEVNRRRQNTEPKPLSDGPFTLLGPVKLLITFTDGGLAVDSRHRVLGSDKKPIPGLYAAGSTGQGGLLLEGHGHHLGWAFTSGRRAGRFAACEVISSSEL